MAHSVHDRLLALAKERGRPFNELLQYFGMERFLYRLSVSPAGAAFVLKGALLLTARANAPYRPTRNIDLLGHVENSEASIRERIREACLQPVTDDGLRFDADSVATERIKEDADYPGIRAKFDGHLERARIAMQVDVGFGDVVTSAPQEIEYPALLDFPTPKLQAYPLETVVAEKLQAMVYLGELNTRMKDFFDVWLLCRQAELKRTALERAVAATFKRRKTDIPDAPACFSSSFAATKQVQWTALLRRFPGNPAPGNFADVVREIRSVVDGVFSKTSPQAPSHNRKRRQLQ